MTTKRGARSGVLGPWSPRAFEERFSASGDPILPFNDSYIIEQLPLPIPGPPGEGEPTVYHLPVIGQLEGTVVNADWKVEWLEPEP